MVETAVPAQILFTQLVFGLALPQCAKTVAMAFVPVTWAVAHPLVGLPQAAAVIFWHAPFYKILTLPAPSEKTVAVAIAPVILLLI